MIKQKKQKKIPYERNIILMFYLNYIKFYSDKIPYFRRVAKNLWIIGWRLSIKLKSFMQSVDLEKTYWINPKKIEYGLKENRQDFLSSSIIYKDIYKDKVTVQDWDLPQNLMKFEERQSYKGYYQHFIEGREWQDVEFYQSVLNEIKMGMFKWGCSSERDFLKRCEELDELYEDIKKNGFKTQRMLGEERILKHRGIRELRDEIQIAIDRDGNLIFYSGQNRLVIAKILNLNQIPVRIYRRHRRWMKFRKRLFYYIKKRMKGRTLEPLLHPDFSDVSSVWGNERFEIVKRNIKMENGKLLDICAHWGYLCHRFEEIGYDCTAFEENLEDCYFLKKLRWASNMNFKVIDQSVYDFEGDLHFDIVLMLNLSHDLLGKKERHDQFVKLLRKIKASEIYLQTSSSLEIKEGNIHGGGGYLREDIISVVGENTNLKNIDCIGEVGESKIFKLYY